ncbi:uncharacterized protein LOC133522734 [Cydia pomonella]|uniref:uncharacterized protein LOC133522734 n=1 Tax=Cydia pomonella TaxID=82600 RepID=UPI002ADE7E79|nr:uncharacterized protein LOC133522734 [Cydia pomonella]
MLSNTLKCNTCNIIIDEMLSYIQNKISISDEDTLVRICEKSFTVDEIQKSKSLLFDALPTNERNIKRKGGGKDQRDLRDIIRVFKATEPDIIPTFVAHQLEKLPPLTFDHLDCSKLLKDILRIQAEINTIKDTYATKGQIEDLRNEMQLSYRYASPPHIPLSTINVKRGAWCLQADSGPYGMSQHHNSTLNDNASSIKQNVSMQINQMEENLQYRTIVDESSTSVPHEQPISLSKSISTRNEMAVETDKENKSTHIGTGSPRTTESQVISCSTSGAQNVMISNSDPISKECLHNKYGDEWKTVTYRKKKSSNRFNGQVGTATSDVNSKFKAAEKLIPIFISKIHQDTNENDIIDYIKTKTHENVSLEKIIMKKKQNHKAFKFFVYESKLPLFLDTSLWPKDIVFRRFVHFKHRYSNRVATEGGT